MTADSSLSFSSLDPIEIVRTLAETTLRQSGLKGIIPTPLDEVARWVGIREVVDIREFNRSQREFHRQQRKPGLVLKRFLGAVFFEPRVVLLDLSKPEEMQRWTQAHETGHKGVPWHEESSYLDDEATLSREAKVQQEREANAYGAHLIFQGSRFWEESLSHKHGLAVPVALAGP